MNKNVKVILITIWMLQKLIVVKFEVFILSCSTTGVISKKDKHWISSTYSYMEYEW